jgi:hypothetical protein
MTFGRIGLLNWLKSFHESWNLNRGVFNEVQSGCAPCVVSLAELIGRLSLHAQNYSDFLVLSSQTRRVDKLPETKALMADAKWLASQLLLIPRLERIEPLKRAHHALTAHWQSLWSNGGISDSNYRGSLKGAMLYLELHDKARAAASFQSANSMLRTAHDVG